MFGTLGFTELILILVIVLIIFGAGRLPQLGEGLGKALKGFKKEVNEASPVANEMVEGTPPPPPQPDSPGVPQPPHSQQPSSTQVATPQPTAPYTPGPELTPGTTAALAAAGAGPQPYQPRQQPPATQPLAAQPPSGVSAGVQGQQARPVPPKRPSAIVNKSAVARVQEQQAALRAKAEQGQAGGATPQDMQGLGETVGDALRTFRQAAADIRRTVDPQMHTIKAEMEAAEKELQQSMEVARQLPKLHEDPPSHTS